MEGKAKKECFSTGLILLDRNLGGGLHKGEMMTVAAETGGGKSILLVQAVAANILEGKSVVFFSLEMSGEDIYRRIAANIAGVPVREMDDYKTNYGRELPMITDALTKLANLPIEVIDFMHDMDSIESEIARAASENRADVIAVDYIQILNMGSSDNRENAISEAARRLKTCAMKHKAVLFTASQVNDEGRLRESRAIGMHSDQVVQIEHIKEKSRIVVKKNRRGARNYLINVEMNGEISKFIEQF
jgi:replicative DNA helicase